MESKTMSSMPTWVRDSVLKLDSATGITIHPDSGFYDGAGYSVGIYPERERRFNAGDTSRVDLALALNLFSRINHDLLGKPRHYIGVWRDTDQFVLDIAIITASSSEAELLGRLNHQAAYYDFDAADTRSLHVAREGA